MRKREHNEAKLGSNMKIAARIILTDFVRCFFVNKYQLDQKKRNSNDISILTSSRTDHKEGGKAGFLPFSSSYSSASASLISIWCLSKA